MFIAFFVAGLVFVFSLGGKVIFLALSAAPLVGVFFDWYFHLVPELGNGVVANITYGFLALQVVLITLSLVLYGPRIVRTAITLLRARRQPVAK